MFRNSVSDDFRLETVFESKSVDQILRRVEAAHELAATDLTLHHNGAIYAREAKADV
jgi:hypothetical protein